MRRTIGRILLGFAGGFLLSRLRAMPGGDATDWAGVAPSTAMGWRAAALALFAFASFGADAGGVWVLLASIAGGYAAHGFVFGPTHGVPWMMLALGVVVLLVGRPLIAKQRDEPPEEGAEPSNTGEKAGLMIAGVGVAIGLEAVARHVRLLGLGLAQDDTVFGVVFLALVAFGAAAFGWITSARSTRRLSFPVALAATSAACFASMAFLDVVADGRGLRPMLDRWHLRVSDVGTLPWDALFGAASFVAPALLLGAGLAGARGRGSWSSALLGAAVGLLAFPRLFDRSSGADGDRVELYSAQLVPLACLVTLVGAALAVLSESRRRPRARYLALFLIGACGIPALTRTSKPIVVLSPFEGRMILPFVVFERGTGLATVEPSRQGLKIATLDRRALTPDVDGIGNDTQRIDDSFAVLPVARKDVRVLFVGQLTPLRSAALSVRGAGTVDRTASWWRSMPLLEKELYKDKDGNTPIAPPTGEILSPKAARERLERGDYDLVIALPLATDAPGIEAVDAPVTTTVVRWLALEEPLSGVVNPRDTKLGGSDVEHAVVISADGLEAPSLALVTNGTEAPLGDQRRVRVLSFERDASVASPWTRLHVLVHERSFAARASTLAAVAEASSDPLAAALARFHAAQTTSSPFEKGGAAIELDAEVLGLFERASAVKPLDPFLRATWNWIARALIEKRDVTSIDRFLAPLAAAHAPWSDLEIALSYADLEGLDAPAAVRRLEPVVEREHSNWRAWFALGEAREIAGDAGGAAQAFETACGLVPNQYPLRRRLAMAQVRSGHPGGHALVTELLVQNPRDEELTAFLGPDSPPPPPKTYTPTGMH